MKDDSRKAKVCRDRVRLIMVGILDAEQRSLGQIEDSAEMQDELRG
jgi:hypothetical protein